MSPALELQLLSPQLALWQAYEPATKAELFSTALRLDDRLFLIDPIRLAPEALSELTAMGKICGVFVTNPNHKRAAEWFAAEYGAALLSSATTASTLNEGEPLAIFAGDKIGDRLEVVDLKGGIEGEIALHLEDDGGTLIVGDALLPTDPGGCALLPAKYCADQDLLRQSLRQLLDFSFARLLFGHGPPLVSAARAKLEAILADR